MTVKRLITKMKSRSVGGRYRSSLLRQKMLGVIIVLMIITVIVLHVYLLPVFSGSYNDECYQNRKRQKDLLHAIQTIGQTMEKYNITYWLDYGTLLGAMSYGDVIPWDGDADISFLLKHEKYAAHKELAALHDIHSTGLMAWYKNESIDYVRWIQEQGFYNHKRELLLYKYYPSSVMERENIIVKYHHKLETFPLAWVVPTKDVDFKGVKLRIPNAPYKLLRHRYPWTFTFGLSVPYKWKCWVPCWIRTANGC